MPFSIVDGVPPVAYPPVIQSKPSNNLVWAILVTLFCCIPFGIVAIIKASSVDSLYNSGRYKDAVDASKEAGKWCIWGAVAGIVVGLLYSILLVAAGG